MKGFILVFSILSCAILPSLVKAEDLYNPLLSYKEQLKNLHKDCQERKYDKDCEAIEKKLGDEMEKMKEACKANPNDERCGAVMKERKEVNTFEQFCQENPHAKKCVVRRTRSNRREKMKRLYCSKNPESARCATKVKDKSKRGFGFYCKSHPDDRRCKVYLERKEMKNPTKKEPDGNSF